MGEWEIGFKVVQKNRFLGLSTRERESKEWREVCSEYPVEVKMDLKPNRPNGKGVFCGE